MQTQQNQNQLSFGVEFTRAQIEELLKNSSVSFIVVSGAYAYQGQGIWDMQALGEGYDANYNKVEMLQSVKPCPKPCP